MHDQPAPIDSYEWPTCGCGRQLRHDELGRTACRLCQERADTALRQLPGPDGLYAQLATRLAPGRGGDSVAVSASRTAPLPVRLEPLSLMARGGVVTILQAWQIDWHEHFGWTHPRWNGNLQQQCDEVVHALRNNLEGAASTHPAFADFLKEVTTLVRQCERQITGERQERPIAVACPCGATLHVTVVTHGVRCRSCNTQYTRTEAFDLPLATRTAA